jgi:N-acetylneuraminic acid mutarotase
MPTARLALAAASLNGDVYAIGGLNSNYEVLSTVETYNPSTNTWSEGPYMSTGRAYLVADSMNGAIYALGGQVPQTMVWVGSGTATPSILQHR